jgi:hypothetical protein
VQSVGIDLDRLLRLRVVVARVGEMDLARWWNTKGQLGPLGTAALRRGFPRTHFFAQARSVFAVAAHRCAERFVPPGCVTLFQLPEAVEEDFEARWEHWLDHGRDWAAFFGRVSEIKSSDLVGVLGAFEPLGKESAAAYAKLKRSAEGRAVELPAPFQGTDDDVTLLAAGFARGEVGNLAVPYARRGPP